MLCITPHVAPDAVTLKVEGTISGPWVQELRVQLEAYRHPVILDLSRVTFMDLAGAALIARARAQGASIHAASHFVSLMLQKDSPETSDAGKEG